MQSGNNNFTKEERICSDKQITRLFDKGTSFICYPLRVVWLETEKFGSKPVKILISVSKKKIHNAVDRNRIKRLIRESYRLNKTLLNSKAEVAGKVIEISFIWLPNEAVEFKKVEKKLREALERISNQIDKPNEKTL